MKPLRIDPRLTRAMTPLRATRLAFVCCLGAALLGDAVLRGEWAWAGATLLLGGFAIAGALRTRVERAGAEPGTVRPAEADAVLLASPDPVLAVDRRGVVRLANAAARTLVPAAKTGEPLSFALRAPDVLDAIRRVVETGEGREAEYGGRTPTEPLIAVRLRPLPRLPTDTSDLPAVALFFSDRTREHRVEAMRVDFIATVSHELRTPLASLTGFIDTLTGPAREDAAARQRFLEIMREQADRMSRLVDDLLQLSRVELTEHVRPTDALDLSAIAAHMIEILTPLAKERGVAIEFDAQDQLPAVRGDRDQLLRVVENLIENAMKYGGPGAIQVRVRRAEGGRAVTLTVTDHGPGIAHEHLPRVTERFYRVNEQESRSKGGTGLGLAIVKHVVGRHRGRLSIESEPGVATTFGVQLPVYEEVSVGP